MTDLQESAAESAAVAVDVTPELASRIIMAMAKRLAAIDDEMPEKPIRVIAWYLRQAVNREE